MADQAKGGLLSPFLQGRRIAATLPFLHGRTLDYGCGNGAVFRHLSADLKRVYIGYDPDRTVIEIARKQYPSGRFTSRTEDLRGPFDSIVSLAVVEHVPSVAAYLATLGPLLALNGEIVITSPRASIDRLHRLGGAIGVFSREASEEHNEYVSETSLRRYASEVGLELRTCAHFLLGVNQLFVLRHAPQAISVPAPLLPGR